MVLNGLKIENMQNDKWKSNSSSQSRSNLNRNANAPRMPIIHQKPFRVVAGVVWIDTVTSQVLRIAHYVPVKHQIVI
jgi:hypothetical protein